ncbi:ABC transporter permease [Halocola ammonii]
MKKFQFTRFIGSRVLRGSDEKRFSRPIITLATISVALGIAVMILAVSIVQGFQQEVREKVVGFGSHIQIYDANDNILKETSRVETNQSFYPSIDTIEGIRHIQLFAIKPGIIETNDNLQAVIIKGVADDFDWSFFDDKLVEGEKISMQEEGSSTDIMVSSYIANRLEIEVGQKVTMYFLQDRSDILPRAFRVKGIYDTGLEEFDQKFVFIDINHIRKINNWGIQAEWRVAQSCEGGKFEIEPLAFGGDGEFSFGYPNDSLTGEGPFSVCLKSDTSFTVVVSDQSETLPDTATVHFDVPEKFEGNCACQNVVSSTQTSGGSYKYYTGGFEVLIDDYEDLWAMSDTVFYRKDSFYLNATTIVERHSEIFSWLEMLDINVVIIIVLMIIVSVINMTSALLIIILERTNMIGVLKAFGIDNSGVVRIFLYQAAVVIGLGLVIGNIIGIGFGWLQKEYSIVKLDPQNYYVSSVPVNLDFSEILFLDFATLAICLVCLILPALYVTRISPVKAIRFD